MLWVFYFYAVEQEILNTIFAAMASLVSVAMWIDYFRKIDVFEPERILPLSLALVIGGISPYLSLYIYRSFSEAGFAENGQFVNDLLYSIFGIGLNEELCKLLAVVLVFKLLKKYINDPIDILIYAGVTALGFSLVENFYYFSNYGIRIISSRSFYSALEHIINTSIIVYGFYRYRIFNRGNHFLNTGFAIVLAIGSHGLFDFFLIHRFLGSFTSLFSLLVYLVGINFWVQMLNNANNYSGYFDYHKIAFSPKIAYRLFYWYSLTLLIAFVNNLVAKDLEFSIQTIFFSLLSDGFLFWIVILRVSRFKIFKKKYFQVKLSLPFYITHNKDEDFTIPFLKLPFKIRGENQREYFLTKYLDKRVRFYSLGKNENSKSGIEVMVTQKILLYDDVIVYSVFAENSSWVQQNKMLLLKPVSGKTEKMTVHRTIYGLYSITLNLTESNVNYLKINELDFISWGVLQPIEEELLTKSKV